MYIQWMWLEEYVAQPFVQKHDLLKNIVDIGLDKTEGLCWIFTSANKVSILQQAKLL